MTPDCILCSIAASEAPARVIGESDTALAFLDINPATEGHTLVIPKDHTEQIWDISAEDAHAFAELVVATTALLRRVVRPEGMTLFQANGGAGWQEVDHVHVHVVPRWSDDGLTRPWGGTPAEPDALDRLAARLRDGLA